MLAVAAFEAAPVLDWPELRDWAHLTVDRLTEILSTSDGAMRHVYRPFQPGAEADSESPLFLGDQAWWLKAILACYQATGDGAYRARAERLVQVLERDFFDAGRGAFRDRVGEGGEGHLSDPHFPIGDNAAAAEALADWAALGGGERWRERAEGILAVLQPEAERLGFLGAAHALATARVLSEPLQIHVVGSIDDGPTRALWAAGWAPYAPARVVELLDPAREPARLAELGYLTDRVPRAYVCVGDRCLEPVSDPDELIARMREATAVATR